VVCIHRLPTEMTQANGRIGATAVVYAASIMEYLMLEVLELVVNTRKISR
jgi:hypothetical protein